MTLLAMPCCPCAKNRACVRCICVQNQRPCCDCYPRREGGCKNPRNALLSSLSSQPVLSSKRKGVTTRSASQPVLSAEMRGQFQDPYVGKDEPWALSQKRQSGGQESHLASSAGDSSQIQPLPPLGDNLDDMTGVNSTPEAPSLDPFIAGVHSAYEEVVSWRRNLFPLPYGKVGGEFVEELTRLIQGFTNGTSLRPVAWKAVCVACHVILQRSHSSSLMTNVSNHISRRLSLWKEGCITELVNEGISIQRRLPQRQDGPANDQQDEKSDMVFSNLVFSGKIKSAIRYLTSESSGGVLDMATVIDDQTGVTVRDVLLNKHPPPSEPPESCLMAGEPDLVSPIIYDRITPELIRKIGRQMQGSSGPSGLDADALCKMLTSYGKTSDRLCTVLAEFARCICTDTVDPAHLEAFTAARLIPLDKRPGVRPIAVGEAIRRLVCRTIMRVTERDVLMATAPLQLCVGVPSACEAGVHSMQRLYEQEDVEAILFVDASNAFNSLNRKAALHNVSRVCPAIGKVFQNTYGKPIRLFVSRGGEIQSAEGTCQGDPCAMALYAVATIPLIRRLAESNPHVRQTWYADDDAAGGTVCDVLSYWEDIQRIGPGYGYFPNPSKTVLLVKPQYEREARDAFAASGVRIVTDGNRHLGGRWEVKISASRSWIAVQMAG